MAAYGHYSLQTASEIKYDLRFEISDPNYLQIHVHIAYMIRNVLAASEVTTASKQPQRSCLTSDFKSVTSITYVAMSLDAPTCPVFLMSGGGGGEEEGEL